MLVEDGGTDGFDAILHPEIVAVVGQCGSCGVVVKPRDNPADAAALRSFNGAYLLESDFPDAYAVFCIRICFIQFLDMESLEVDRFLLNGRCRSRFGCKWFS